MKPDIPQTHFGSSPGGWLMALSRRIDRALHDDLLATEAALLTCKYEGSWLEVYDVHYLTPLVQYWNHLHQELIGGSTGASLRGTRGAAGVSWRRLA